MNPAQFCPYVLVMAGVTYLIRMLPLTVFRRKLKSPFIRSFLFYAPYAVLAAMTLPDILCATGNIYTALIGLGVALALSWLEKGLLTVALCACAAVYLSQFFIR